MFIAQVTEVEVCGAGTEANLICQLVFRSTENEVLARSAGALRTLIVIIVIILIAMIISRLARRLVSRFAKRMEGRIEERLARSQASGAMTNSERYRTRRFQRLGAIAGVLRGVVAVAIWLTAILLAISEAGISLQPILAGAGLIGIVIGFGAQQLVRDVLAGIAMLIEDQYGVGDWIEVDGIKGEVERVGLRSTAFRDLDGVVHHVLNGYMQRVGNLSQQWARSTFDVPLALDADVPAAKALIHKVATDLADDPVWGEDIIGAPEIWGVQEFGPQGIAIRVVIPTKPLRNWDVTRQLRERLKLAFEQAHIRMPSQLVEVGGQRAGYAILNREIPDDDRQSDRARRRGLVPQDVGPMDRPPPREPTTGEASEQDPTVMAGDGANAADDDTSGDYTTELRKAQGPRARPD